LGAHPTLSIIIATRRGWPAMEPALDSVSDQAAAVGGEVLILDASGLPGPPDLAPHVRWISRPTHESVFAMRAAGLRQATGDIVAVTEDHCRATPDWCRRILEGHAAHPEAAAIGGAIDNGTGTKPIDWAAFIVTQFPYAAPLPRGPVPRTTGASNISLKRWAVERLPEPAEDTPIALLDSATISTDGEILVSDDTILVWHDQSLGFVGTTAIEFHNGRTIGGFRRGIMDQRDWVRVAGAGVLPFYRSARAVRAAFGKRIPRRAVVTSIPWVLWLQLCTSAGELLGYASGPGDSANRLR
jgi:Glycosyl transferase family 2